MKIDNINIDPQWEKSKDDIWNETFSMLRKEADTKPKKVQFNWKPIMYYAAASVAILIIALPSIAFFYTKNEIAARGTHQTVLLPDGSKVELNADSKLSYKPLWWYVSRDVKLEGEAYFEVEKGSDFHVESGQYTVSVLGTSFNVFSRADKFSATCLTGKVRVADKNDSVVLSPNMQALVLNSKLQSETIADATQSVNWVQNKFVFLGVPLEDVIAEIERQYNINVTTNSSIDYLYSGNFTKTKKPEDVLEIVGEPFDIKFKIK